MEKGKNNLCLDDQQSTPRRPTKHASMTNKARLVSDTPARRWETTHKNHQITAQITPFHPIFTPNTPKTSIFFEKSEKKM